MLNKSHITKLWMVFTGAYGQNWTSRGMSDIGDVWLNGLSDLTPQEFEKGLSAIVQSDSPFPPSLGQFRSWCRTPVIALSPSDRAHVAWQTVMEANEVPPDPITRKVMRAFGGWSQFCRSLTTDNLHWHEKRFIEHYAALCESEPLQVIEGGKRHEIG